MNAVTQCKKITKFCCKLLPCHLSWIKSVMEPRWEWLCDSWVPVANTNLLSDFYWFSLLSTHWCSHFLMTECDYWEKLSAVACLVALKKSINFVNVALQCIESSERSNHILSSLGLCLVGFCVKLSDQNMSKYLVVFETLTSYPPILKTTDRAARSFLSLPF